MSHEANARLRLWMMMALTFVTGALDAVGYLGMDRIFTGNMTGNIVILGMASVGGHGLPTVGPASALAAFMTGAAISGAVLRRSSKAWNVQVSILLAIGTVILIACAVVLLTSGAHPEWLRVTIASAIALQMGSQALIARFLAVKDMTTVVVTSTLTSLAGESLFGPGNRLMNRRFWAIAMLFAGAVSGAALMRVNLSVPVFVAAAVTGIVLVLGILTWNPSPRGRADQTVGGRAVRSPSWKHEDRATDLTRTPHTRAENG